MAMVEPRNPGLGAQEGLARMNRRLVGMEMIGQDPDMGCVTFIIIGEVRNTSDPNRFSVHFFRDWTLSADVHRGYCIDQGYYGMTRREAVERMADLVRGRRDTYCWVMPPADYWY